MPAQVRYLPFCVLSDKPKLEKVAGHGRHAHCAVLVEDVVFKLIDLVETGESFSLERNKKAKTVCFLYREHLILVCWTTQSALH